MGDKTAPPPSNQNPGGGKYRHEHSGTTTSHGASSPEMPLIEYSADARSPMPADGTQGDWRFSRACRRTPAGVGIHGPAEVGAGGGGGGYCPPDWRVVPFPSARVVRPL